MRWILFCWPLALCQAQPLPADLSLIAKIKARASENLAHLPNYTCTQTIERSQRRAANHKFELVDTIRLEVALVAGKELFGWPGANRIAESEVTNLVGGTIGNGDFGLLARSIFLADAASFHYAGETELKEQKAIRFDYRVPLLSSGYHLRVAPNEAVVAYHGSFWVQPESFDLMRLDLFADDVPTALGLEAATNRLEYARVPIGGGDFLLPRDAELVMTDLAGGEHRNRTQFSGCRQYAGESVLSFGDPPPDVPEAPKPAVTELPLPEEFTAEMTLLTPINSETSAVGDEVQARLERAVKDHRRVLVPKGTVVFGRLKALHRMQGAFHVTIDFHLLEFEHSRADLEQRENTVTMMAAAPGSAGGRSPMNRASWGMSAPAPAAGGHDAPLVIEGSHLRMPRGFFLYLHSRLIKSVTE
jgi:hypothetical protein